MIPCEGDFIIIPPNMAHSLCGYNNSRYSILSICIQKDLVERCEIDYVLQEIQQASSLLVEKKLITEGEISTIKDAVSSLYAGRIGTVALINKEIIKVKELLINAPEYPFLIDDLSERTYISPYHLIRSFKAQIGLTPHQFQIQNRIRKAQYLLREKSTITEVALATGFCDQSHFNNCFKRLVGITPLQYIHAQQSLPK